MSSEKITEIRIMQWLAMAFLIAVAQHYIYIYQGFRASDDNVYSYMLGQAVFNGDEIESYQKNISDRFDATNTSEEFRYRFKIRQGYLKNYIYHSSLQYFTANYLNPAMGVPKEPYSVFLAYAMVSGVVLAFILCLVGVLFFIRSFRSYAVSRAVAFTFLLFCLLDLLPTGAMLDNMMQHPSIVDSMHHAFNFILKTNAQYNLMSFPERTNFYMAAFLVFVLRFVKRFGWAYWGLVGLCFFHQSQAGLLLAILMVVDLILRPMIFKEKAVVSGAIVAGLLFGFRESLWFAIGSKGLIIIILFVILIGAVAFFSRARLMEHPVFDNFVKMLCIGRSQFIDRTGEYSDAILLLIGWLLSWPIFYVIVQKIDHFSTYYFWAGVHGRSWAMISPFLLFCLVKFCLIQIDKRESNSNASRGHVVLSLVFLLLAAPVIHKASSYFIRDQGVIARVVSGLAPLDQNLELIKISHGDSQSDEMAIYFSIAKSFDKKLPFYKGVFAGQRIETPNSR